MYYYDVMDASEVLAHYEEEMRRRAEVQRAMQMVHETPQAVGSSAPQGQQQPQHQGQSGGQPPPAQVLEMDVSKDPNEQRARLEAQRKARRKANKK